MALKSDWIHGSCVKTSVRLSDLLHEMKTFQRNSTETTTSSPVIWQPPPLCESPSLLGAGGHAGMMGTMALWQPIQLPL